MTGTERRTFVDAHIVASGFRGAMARHWALVVTLVAGMGYMAIITLLHSQAVSPIDEPQYIDYIDKVYGQGIVRSGEYLGELVRGLFACHGVIPFGVMGAACGSDMSDPSVFPFGGISSAPIYTPVQFWIDRLVGDAIGLIPGIDQLAGWRLVGTLWLGGGLVFCYLIARRFRATGWGFVAVALACVASPFGYWTFSFVSTDAPIFLFGAITLWLTMRIARGESSGWWLVALGAAGALFKATSLVAVGFAFVYLIAYRILQLRRSGATAGAVVRGVFGRTFWLPLLGVVANVVVAAVWTKLIPIFAVRSSAVDQGVATPPTFDLFGQQFVNFLGGALQWVVPQTDANNLFLPLQWLAVAAVVGAVLIYPRGARDRALPVSLLIGYLIAAPVLALSVVIATGSFFPIPPRYGIALIPALIAVVLPLMRNRWAVRALLAYTAVLLMYQLGMTLVFARWYP